MLIGFVLPLVNQESDSNSRPIFEQDRPTPFFIAKSQTSDKLPKLNRVGMPELRRSFNHDLLVSTSGALSPFRSNPSAYLIFNKVFNYGHRRTHNKSVTFSPTQYLARPRARHLSPISAVTPLPLLGRREGARYGTVTP